MTIYIKDFRFTSFLGNDKIKFKYYTGKRWKRCSFDNEFKGENVTVYSRKILDVVTNQLCGKETDVHKRNEIIKRYEAELQCVFQLNKQVFDKATKIFS